MIESSRNMSFGMRECIRGIELRDCKLFIMNKCFQYQVKLVRFIIRHVKTTDHGLGYVSNGFL
jgi:hypothetical protein